jgi:hypothetical protein
MIDVSPVLTQLRTNVPLARTIEHAWFMDPLENYDETTPAIYVYPGAEKGQPSELDNYIAQAIEGAIVVFIVATHEQLAPVRKQMMEALIGWQATTYCNGLQFVEGERRNADPKCIWWRDVFTDQFQRRQKD